MNKTRSIYLDVLKIAAILLVIFNHSHFSLVDNNIFIYTFHSFVFSICKIAVPIFIMTSGALLLKKTTEYKEIFTKRIFRIAVPLLVISLMWTLYMDNGNHLLHFPLAFIYGLESEYIPYWGWYLYMLIGLYMVMPFLKKMITNFKDIDYKVFICLFVFLPGVLELFSLVINNFTNKTFIFSPHLLAVFFSISIGYFISGYYFSRLELNKRIKNIAWFALSFCVLINTGIQVCNYWLNGSTEFLIDAIGMFTMSVSAFSVFVLTRYYLENKKESKIDNLIIQTSSCVFGVYLFHVFVLEFIGQLPFMKALLDFNSYIWIFTIDVLTFISLSILIYFARKIPLFRKFL